MTTTFSALLKALLFGGGGIAAFIWLTKQLVGFWLSRNVEAFKSKLQASADAEVEKLKSSLQMTALEHQVVFSKLHEKRAEVIAELYKALVFIFWEGQRFVLTASAPNRDQEYEKLTRSTNEFVLQFETKRIYLKPQTCLLLDQYIEKVRKAVIRAEVYSRGSADSPNAAKDKGDALMSAYLAFENEILKTKYLK